MRKGVFKLGLALGSVLVALAVGEIGCRVWLSARGTPYAAAEMETELRELAHRAGDDLPLPGDAELRGKEERARAVLHPYFGYDAAYGLDETARWLRLQRGGGPDPYDILILGGSVAGVFHSEGTDELERLLEADPRMAGRELRITGYPRGAYKQPQQLIVLGYLLSLGLRPDAVLNIDGFNEVAVANTNVAAGMHPAHPSYGNWVPKAADAFGSAEVLRRRVELLEERESLRRTASRALGAGVSRSALVGHVFLHWLLGREKRLRQESVRLLEAVRTDPALLGPPFAGGTTATVDASVRIWFEASRSMQALCDSRGIYYVQVLQPTLHDEGAKPITADEERTGEASQEWLDGVRLGYPLLRAGLRRLREEFGINAIDCSRVFAELDQTIYYDACHFRNPGNELFARAIAPGFLDGLPAAPPEGDQR